MDAGLTGAAAGAPAATFARRLSAGQATLSVLAFVRLAHRWIARAAAVAGLLVLVGTMATFGWYLACAGVLLAAGAALGSIGRAGDRS